MMAGIERYPFFYGPEGRLTQVDYAQQAVARGSTTLGIKNGEFAVLLSHIKPTRPLLETTEKVYEVDSHIGMTGSGYIGDLQTLLDELRVASQRHRLQFETPIDVGSLAKALGSYLHAHTMAPIRPFGASLLLAGVDPLGVQLWQIDPGGTTFRGSAFTIGYNADAAQDVLQAEYQPGLSEEQAIVLGRKAIQAAIGETPLVEVGIIRRATGRFERIPPVPPR